MALVTLEEVKAHLNIVTSEHDTELLSSYLDSATAVVEHFVGAVDQRSVTEVYSGSGQSAIVLRSAPAISITSVTVNGTLLPSTDYTYSSSGMLIRVSGFSAIAWTPGVENIEVVYVAGRDPVPAYIRLAALIIIGHMWETQYNLSNDRPQLGELEPGAFDPRLSYSIPRRATELLQVDSIPGV